MRRSTTSSQNRFLLRTVVFVCVCLFGSADFFDAAAYGRESGSSSESRSASPAEPTDGLSLAEVVRLTLAHDPLIALARTAVLDAEGSLTIRQGVFDDFLSADFTAGRQETPLGESSASVADAYDLQVRWQRLLRGGMSISSGVDLNRDAPESVSTSNEATVFFALRRPLLRGSQREVVAAAERSAESDLEAAWFDLRHAVSERILATTLLYWNFESARRRLEILLDAEDTSRRILATTERLVEADLTPSAEIIQLEADLMSRIADRVAGEQALFSAQQRLGSEIGLEPAQIRILPSSSTPFPAFAADAASDVPQGAEFEADLDRWADLAWNRRADLAAELRRLEASRLLLGAAEDALRPQLDLIFRPSYSGFVDGDSVDDFFSPLVQNVPGASASLGLSFSWPIRNDGAEGAVLQRRASEQAVDHRIDRLRRTIAADVAIALNAVRLGVEQSRRIKRSVELFRKTLENEEKKLQAGSSTLIDVITQRNRLTGAQQQQVAIEAALAAAIADLRFQTGALISPGENSDPTGAPPSDIGRVDVERLLSLPSLADFDQEP